MHFALSRLALCSILLTASLLSAQAQSPVAVNGRLRTQGNQVVNEQGVPPQLRGISFSWSIWGGKKYYTPETLNWLCNDFKVSVVRIALAVQPANGYLQVPDEQKKRIIPVIDRAIENGIYVLIDWHDHNSDQHLEASRNFFAEMARRYSGKPNVIYEVWNEPEKQSWEVVKNYATEIIKEIRKYDSQNLIIVGSPHWDQDVDIAAKTPIKGFDNIAYSFHFYASDPNHQDSLRTRADKAIQMGLPLFVTEWGVGEADGNGVFDRQKTEKWLNWLEENKLSWTNWNITDKKETTAILKPGARTNGNWKKKDLTPAGAYIRKVLRKLNKGTD